MYIKIASWIYIIVYIIPFVECGGEGVMKPNNVSSVSTNQTKWSTGQSKNFIINAVPVKNEV